MPPKKELKKFCSLSKYIEQEDPELYGVFSDLCMLSYLRPRSSEGITFLFPKEKSYRQKIINAAYSTDPTVASEMLRSLIIKKYYPSTRTFGNEIVNMLNQKVDVSETSDKHVKLKNGLELKIDEKFKPLGYRENMIVYTLSGKGEISTSGPSAGVVEPKQKKKGGSSALTSSSLRTLQKLLVDTYASEMDNKENVFKRKVALQLYLLLKESYDSADQEALIKEVRENLGNDEFSDSYLLDQFCLRRFPALIEILVEFLQETNKKTGVDYHEKYIKYKKIFIAKDDQDYEAYKNVYPDRLRGIKSPMDFRQRIKQYYGDKKDRMAKDLFIVFCNVYRDMWSKEVTREDSVNTFNNFAYVASKVYDHTSCLLKQDFDVARDLTLYGNLLKSDVFMFEPRVDYGPSPLRDIPQPDDLKLYSLSAYINKPKASTGGSSKYSNL